MPDARDNSLEIRAAKLDPRTLEPADVTIRAEGPLAAILTKTVRRLFVNDGREPHDQLPGPMIKIAEFYDDDDDRIIESLAKLVADKQAHRIMIVDPVSAVPGSAMAREIEDRDGLLETAWVIIANGSGGDWDTADPKWKEAAARWRDEYHALLDRSRPKAEDAAPAAPPANAAPAPLPGPVMSLLQLAGTLISTAHSKDGGSPPGWEQRREKWLAQMSETFGPPKPPPAPKPLQAAPPKEDPDGPGSEADE